MQDEAGDNMRMNERNYDKLMHRIEVPLQMLRDADITSAAR